MALGQHEAVALRIVDRRRPNVQLGAEQARHDIRAGQRSAGMAGGGAIDRGNQMPPGKARSFGNLDFDIRRGHRRKCRRVEKCRLFHGSRKWA